MAYDAKKKTSIMRYLDTLKEVRFRIKPEEYEAWSRKAISSGFVKDDGSANMRQFILAAVERYVPGK